MDTDAIYLDHNATTPIDERVLDAMLPYLRERFGNPSSGHGYGQLARGAVERAREQVASLIGAAPDEIVFTSGGTEANNLAIRGVAERASAERRRVVTTAIEHPATERPCAWLERNGFTVARVGVDAEGRARLDAARHAIDARTALVTVMHSNNETGVLQPVSDLAELARAHGALVHTDAAQSVAKVPIDLRELAVDLLSIAGHKLYAPKGVGALFVRRGTAIAPFALGAGHERGLRPGTENVASIVGLGAACALAEGDMATESARVSALRDELWTRIRSAVPRAAINGHDALRLPNTLNVRFVGVSGTALLARATEVAASTGSACHDGHESASPVILAMGVAPDEARSSVRLTLGRMTQRSDVTRAADALIAAYEALCQR
jgi:cysteine desulfurase